MNSPGRIAALTSESTTRPARASVTRSSSMAFTVIVGPPRLRPHWPIRPLRCPQKRGRNSRLGAALRRSSGSTEPSLDSFGEQEESDTHQDHEKDRGVHRRQVIALGQLVDELPEAAEVDQEL